jgi:hypothetical protein
MVRVVYGQGLCVVWSVEKQGFKCNARRGEQHQSIPPSGVRVVYGQGRVCSGACVLRAVLVSVMPHPRTFGMTTTCCGKTRDVVPFLVDRCMVRASRA